MKKYIENPRVLLTIYGFLIFNIAVLIGSYLYHTGSDIFLWTVFISILLTIPSYFLINKTVQDKIIAPLIKSQKTIQGFKDIIDNSLNEIFIFDKNDLHFKYINHGAICNTGYTLKEMQNMTPSDIKPELTKEAFSKEIEPLLTREKDQLTIDTIHQRKDGTHYDCDIRLQLMFIEGEEMFVAFVNDITQKNKALEEKHRFYEISTHDHLTGIYNRQKFDELYKEEFKRFNRYGSNISLIIFDIDDFKIVNDTYGHQAGDNVLKKLARFTQSVLRTSDVFARWGGEEFVILMPHTDLNTAVQKAQQICNGINTLHFDLIDSITCSFGVTEIIKTDTETSAFNRADKAMYHSKSNGKNRISSV